MVWPGKGEACRKVGVTANLVQILRASTSANRRVGTKKRALRSNQETDEGQKICRSGELLDKKSPIQGPSVVCSFRSSSAHILPHPGILVFEDVTMVHKRIFPCRGSIEGHEKLGLVFDQNYVFPPRKMCSRRCAAERQNAQGAELQSAAASTYPRTNLRAARSRAAAIEQSKKPMTDPVKGTSAVNGAIDRSRRINHYLASPLTPPTRSIL